MRSLTTDVAVIGGGAAGMLAAAVSAERGRRTVILEPNEKLGKKLYLTGKGRCNLTNLCGVEEALRNIPRNGRFMYSSLSRFSPSDVMAYFESLGLPLKTERGNRVFPRSDKSSDVIAALERRLRQLGVMVARTRARGILTEGGAVTGVAADGGGIACANAVVCTGGLSYPATGSTGDGYAMAEALGHAVVKPRPSLAPLECVRWELCRRMQGLSLRNVGLTVTNSAKKKVFQEQGELLFTHFGLSGPMALSASAHMRDFENDSFCAIIDLKPALDFKTLDSRILRDFNGYANRDFANALDKLLNRLMIPVVTELSGIPPETKVNAVTREQRRGLVGLLKGFRLDISGTRPVEEAIVTSGGVRVSEIDPATMESKLVRGLFFAGEVLDVDAYTGGFNLQIAWSTAHAAGNGVR